MPRRLVHCSITPHRTVPLLENWRMCDVRCDYPASSIYPDGYAPATLSIAGRRLPPASDAESDLVDAVLDPAFPSVVCVLEDVHATAENRIEATLVADVTMALRSRFAGADDTAFWRDHLFVVSPHHVQIRAIRRPAVVRPAVGHADRAPRSDMST